MQWKFGQKFYAWEKNSSKWRKFHMYREPVKKLWFLKTFSMQSIERSVQMNSGTKKNTARTMQLICYRELRFHSLVSLGHWCETSLLSSCELIYSSSIWTSSRSTDSICKYFSYKLNSFLPFHSLLFLFSFGYNSKWMVKMLEFASNFLIKNNLYCLFLFSSVGDCCCFFIYCS